MLYEMIVPACIKSLTNLDHLLAKAETHASAKKMEVDVFLGTRLIADMLPFSKQIHIACDTAKLGVSRLTGKPAPANDDQEKTWAEFRTRIQQTLSYLKDFTAKDFEGAETRHVTTPRWEGKYLTGMEYATEHVLPNLYFHVTMAYAILRENGVDIGKKDYLGEMPFKK